MTDLLLGPENDLALEGGSLAIIDTKEVLTRQRLLFKLRTFTNTLFTNINFGLDQGLIFKKNTKNLLDQEIKTLIEETEGVIALVSFSSKVGTDRRYVCNFEYSIETGEIVGVNGLVFGSSGLEAREGVWLNGKWDYTGSWKDDEIWGS